MKLYGYDRNKDIRVFEAADDTDLSKQAELKEWIKKETGIEIFSPILATYPTPKIQQKK